MLARLLFREEIYSGPRQGLLSSRYIRTVKLINDGRRVYLAIRTRFFEDELRFQAYHGIQTRPGGNTRLERYAEDRQPGLLEDHPSATTRPRVAVPGETNLSTQVTTDTAVA